MILPDTVVRNNKKLEVLTPTGFQPFLGVNKIKEDQYIHLRFEDGNELKCSLDHPLLTIEGIIKAKDLNKKTEVITKEGGTFLKSRRVIKKEVELYDIVNSGTDHLYYSNNIVSHNCEFLGSVDTLISGAALSNLMQKNPIKSNAGLDVYEEPKKGHQYVMTVDVARGIEIDYSAFVIIDITQYPYEMVAKYRNNEIKPIVFPYVIHESAKAYNNAHVLCEVNDVGDQVAAGLHYDLEYSNVLMCAMRGRAGQILGQGFSGMKTQLGIKMSKNTKKVGCFNLKAMIEENKLIVQDYDTILELSTFVQKHNTFQAEEGCNDDLVMCIHRHAQITTEDGIKSMKWIVDNKYSGKVLSIDKNNNFVWNSVIGHSVKPNTGKKWIGIRGNSKNTLICTTDHKVAYIDDIFDPVIKYTEAENMLGKYNVILPGQRFHKTNPLFNKEQISALVGTLLGDSSISKTGQYATGHGEAQKEYAEHKAALFNSNIKEYSRLDKFHYRVDGISNAHTRYFREALYPNGAKEVKNVLHLLDEISLAYWYMDNGSRRNNSLVICTDSFTYEEHEMIVEMFKNKFNVNAEIRNIYNTNPKTKTKTLAYRISMNSKDSEKFFDLVAPYIIPSMRYKIPERYHDIEQKELSNKPLDFGSEKITKIMDRNGKGWESKLYDITVENTHNFVANGMVAHNCLVIFSWLVCQDYFKEMTSTDIRAKLYEEKQNQMEQDMAPFGFIIDGTEGDNDFAVEADAEGVKDRWMRIKKSDLGNNPDVIDVPLDEYGGMQYMVDWLY